MKGSQRVSDPYTFSEIYYLTLGFLISKSYFEDVETKLNGSSFATLIQIINKLALGSKILMN